MSWWNDAAARYGPILIGLGIGTAAKQGLALNDGKAFTWRAFIADILLLGFLGVVAVSVADQFHLTGNAKVLMGAMTAVSSDRLVRAVRKKFEQRVASEIDQLPTARLARLIGGEPPQTGEDFTPLLEKIDAADRLLPKE
ncbi:hypothetical protein [uncultured Sphingomonas sp.]|uniref:hypothetical protein n=1 Tax=uncultured Sphingomonas sp. TaxID=158754 RepID=UPI0026181724|nr:hypothetical protein [uncultured Sphingomonas sp.]